VRLREERSRLSRSASVAQPITTCSTVGTGLPASSKMAGSALRTIQPSAPFEDLRWGENCGSSPGPSAALIGRGHDHADHDGQAQRRRSEGLAGRCARPNR
jgi:hypothetical protein